MSLTHQLLDGIDATPRLFEIIRIAAKEHIATLPSNAQPLHEQLDRILASASAANESNPLARLNVTALQIAVMFTIYYESIQNRKAFWTERGITNGRFEYPNVESIREGLFDRLIKIDWQDYAAMKHFMEIEENSNEGLFGMRFILNPPTAKQRYVSVVGFLTLREIVDAMLIDVNYLGLSFSPQNVDGNVLSPTAYYIHDMEHSFGDSKINPRLRSDIIAFLQYVTANKPAPVQYSVYFVLFYLMHEGGAGFNLASNHEIIDLYSHYTSFDDLWVFLRFVLMHFINRFTNTTHFGPSIPASYRVPTKDPHYIEKGKVTEYLELAVTRYVDAWEDFQKSRA